VSYNRRIDIWTLQYVSDSAATAVIQSLHDDPGVEAAQPNYVYQRAASPDDELYSSVQVPYLSAINAPAAWDIEQGDPSVTVAVIDGGVDIDHPELEGRIWTNRNDPLDGLDNDSNGCIDDFNGCSFQSPQPDGNVGDLDGHGTFVAGIVSAKRNNGAGIAGISDSTIMPVRLLDQLGGADTPALADAIHYAVNNRADIINLSLILRPKSAGDPKCPKDGLAETALQEANAAGVVVVAATGNFESDCVGFPASDGTVIAVSASGPTERLDIRAHFSNYGPEVDVTAPGMGIASTCPIPTEVPTPAYCPGSAYGVSDGTSFSTPIVAGIASLLLAQHPSLTPAQVRDRLKQTAHPMPDDQHANWDGAGRVDAAAALGAVPLAARLDIAVPSVADLEMSLLVMESGEVQCLVPLWNERADAPEMLKQVFHRPSISGTFGVNPCAGFWPPTPTRPWRLVVDNRGSKAATLNAWSLESPGLACTVLEPNTSLPAERQTSSDINCSASLDNDDVNRAARINMSHLPLRFEVELRHKTSAADPVPSCVPPAPPGGVSFSRTTWYRLEGAPASDGLVIDAFGSEMDRELVQQSTKTVLAVYRWTGGALDEVACDVRFAPAGRVESRLVWRHSPGSVYYVMAAAYESVPMGVLRLNISPLDLPNNDDIDGAEAFSLVDSHPLVQPGFVATAAATDPAASCFGPYIYSLWFKVREDAGQTLVFTTDGSDYNTAAAIYKRGDTGEMSPVACNNNEPTNPGEPVKLTSRVEWQSDGGEYYVVVGGFRDIGSGVLRAALLTEP
jgi:hypothetical protein